MEAETFAQIPRVLGDEATKKGPARYVHLEPYVLALKVDTGNLLVGIRGKRLAIVVALGVTISVVVAVWAWSSRAPRRAIETLPPAERQALYERTLQTLRTTCSVEKGRRGLEGYCRQQAEFILLFPECDAVCWRAAEPYRPEPTR